MKPKITEVSEGGSAAMTSAEALEAQAENG